MRKSRQGTSGRANLTCDFSTEGAVDENVAGLEVSVDYWRGKGGDVEHALDNVGDNHLEEESVDDCRLVVEHIVEGAVLHMFHHKHGFIL